MLDEKIYKLAESGYEPKRRDEMQSFFYEIGRVQSELASKGIVGGPGVQYLTQTGMKAVRGLVTLSASELLKAAESSGVKASNHLQQDLVEALGRMTKADPDEITNALRHHVMAHQAGGDPLPMLRAGVDLSQLQEVAVATADFSHYAVDRQKNAGAKRTQLILTFLGGSAAIKVVEYIGGLGLDAFKHLHH